MFSKLSQTKLAFLNITKTFVLASYTKTKKKSLEESIIITRSLFIIAFKTTHKKIY